MLLWPNNDGHVCQQGFWPSFLQVHAALPSTKIFQNGLLLFQWSMRGEGAVVVSYTHTVYGF